MLVADRAKLRFLPDADRGIPGAEIQLPGPVAHRFDLEHAS
jgi:hypothetical protein